MKSGPLIVFHDIPLYSTEFHNIPLYSMMFYDIAGCSMLRPKNKELSVGVGLGSLRTVYIGFAALRVEIWAAGPLCFLLLTVFSPSF